MDVVRLRDRLGWWVLAQWPPGLAEPEGVCAAVVIDLLRDGVVLHLNPEGPCTWVHLPWEVERAVDAFIDLGPDAGWERFGEGCYATAVVPGDPGAIGAHTGRPRPSVEELERDLRFLGQ